MARPRPRPDQRVIRVVRDVTAPVLRLWRRSVQLRVVGSTVVLSGLAIALTGWALLGDIAQGLADSRRESAVAEARAGLDRVQSQLVTGVETEPSAASQAIAQLVDSQAQRGGGPRRYELVIEGPLTTEEATVPVRSSSGVSARAVPGDLADAVRDDDGVFWRYARLPAAGNGGEDPVLVVGSRLRVPSTGDLYAVYYVFSMAEQQSTLALVRNALLLAGVAMVVMLGGLALLVSRQVLGPVRLARRIAERFASGNLEQRMHVRGEDDIARLSTSFNQMAASLQTQITRLENLSRLQQRFVSDVSHELRTPLTTVTMAGAVLYDARSRFDPPTARAAELLLRELQRFEGLLSDLMDLSRFDAGAAQLETDALDLAEVARRVADDPVLARKGLRVVVRGADQPAVVEADDRRVERIVRNLATNAAAYSGSADVVVTVAQDDRCVSLSVRDHGSGLDEDQALRVFDRFWRADPARSSAGTGLGLAIAREDARLHGGTLRVGSRVGEGTDFVLTLPKPGGDVRPPALEPMGEHVPAREDV